MKSTVRAAKTICAAQTPVEVADQFEATVIWMDEVEMTPGRAYWLKLGPQTVSATVAQPKYQVNVNTMDHLAAKTLDLNAIGVANVTVDRDIPFVPYEGSRDLGGFILIDKMTNRTVGAGLIHFSLRRAQNIHRQATDISREHHASMKNQKPNGAVDDGLVRVGQIHHCESCGKEARTDEPSPPILLDGDNVRHGLNKDLGFTDAGPGRKTSAVWARWPA